MAETRNHMQISTTASYVFAETPRRLEEGRGREEGAMSVVGRQVREWVGGRIRHKRRLLVRDVACKLHDNYAAMRTRDESRLVEGS